MKDWKELLRNNLYLLIYFGSVCLFFYPFIFFGKIPIPADTIVGMYHPWRDIKWDNFENGIPFKNYLITDPVRQQYVWRKLAIENLKKGNLPLWNPYSFSGTPLLANFQTAAFYPLNILFFILQFDIAWGILVTLQILLGGLFMYLYLRQIKVSQTSCFVGMIGFAFSGFSVAWLEWNTIGHVILWLPLTLLAIEKILQKNVRMSAWVMVFVFSLLFSFLAGHIQIFFYSFFIVISYLIGRILLLRRNWQKFVLIFTGSFLMFGLFSSIQWVPTLKFIGLSARNIDQTSIVTKDGWFIPLQNLIQFLAPDFFGNPATNNYWGVWNYGEFVGYIGMIPLILSIYAIVFRFGKKTIFWGCLVLTGLLFSLNTPIGKLPFIFQIPFISTSQPTRLIFIVDFALCILAALGFDQILKDKKINKILIICLPILFIVFILWLFTLYPFLFISVSSKIVENIVISRRNLILPTIIFMIAFGLLIIISTLKNNRIRLIVQNLLLLVIILDLLRFSWKFTPFSKPQWIYPSTNIVNILKKEGTGFRIMALDRRIMPPNFSAYYYIQDVAGYDPLYLLNYNKLVSSWERDKPDLAPSSFNRIITPMFIDGYIANLLGVKFVLSLQPLKTNKLNLVITEGTTYLYNNPQAFPKVFFVDKIEKVKNQQEEIEKMFNLKDKLREIAVSTEDINLIPYEASSHQDVVEVILYSDNYLRVRTVSERERLLVVNDIYYPSWRVYIDGKQDKIHRVDFALRGVVVPAGEHIIEFRINLI